MEPTKKVYVKEKEMGEGRALEDVSYVKLPDYVEFIRTSAIKEYLDKWLDHAVRGMEKGNTAYHQGKVALITDLQDWMMEDGREVRIIPSDGELLPNLATTEQWRRLVASGLPQVAYTLASLWNIIHGMDCIYEFDNTMAADELMEELVSIIELEACAKKQKTES